MANPMMPSGVEQNQTKEQKEQYIEQCFQEFKNSADNLISLVNKAKEENKGVLPDYCVEAIQTAKDALKPLLEKACNQKS
jgi:hypothetical protein